MAAVLASCLFNLTTMYIDIHFSLQNNCVRVIYCLQGKHVLAASNDYAARIWGVHDQKIRVSLCAVMSSAAWCTMYYHVVASESDWYNCDFPHDFLLHNTAYTHWT